MKQTKTETKPEFVTIHYSKLINTKNGYTLSGLQWTTVVNVKDVVEKIQDFAKQGYAVIALETNGNVKKEKQL